MRGDLHIGDPLPRLAAGAHGQVRQVRVAQLLHVHRAVHAAVAVIVVFHMQRGVLAIAVVRHDAQRVDAVRHVLRHRVKGGERAVVPGDLLAVQIDLGTEAHAAEHKAQRAAGFKRVLVRGAALVRPQAGDTLPHAGHDSLHGMVKPAHVERRQRPQRGQLQMSAQMMLGKQSLHGILSFLSVDDKNVLPSAGKEERACIRIRNCGSCRTC